MSVSAKCAIFVAMKGLPFVRGVKMQANRSNKANNLMRVQWI